MPSMSSLTTAYSKRADKLKFFTELSQLRDSQRKKKGLKPASVAYKDAGQKPLKVLMREAMLASEQARATIKKKSSEPLDEKKFGGMTEEEVCKRELPDHMTPGLDIIFVRFRITGVCKSSLKNSMMCSVLHFALSQFRSLSLLPSLPLSFPRLVSTLDSTPPTLVITTATKTTTSVSSVWNTIHCESSSVFLFLNLCHAGPCLYESGLTPKKLTFREDAEVLHYGMGVTNIVPRTTRAADELSKLVYIIVPRSFKHNNY